MRKAIDRFFSEAAILGRNTVFGLLSLLLVAMATALITIPTWLLSARAPKVYAILIFLLLTVILLWWAARFIQRTIRDSRTAASIWTTVIWPLSRLMLETAAALVILYAGTTFFAAGRLIPGICAAVSFFVFLVFARSTHRRDK